MMDTNLNATAKPWAPGAGGPPPGGFNTHPNSQMQQQHHYSSGGSGGNSSNNHHHHHHGSSGSNNHNSGSSGSNHQHSHSQGPYSTGKSMGSGGGGGGGGHGYYSSSGGGGGGGMMSSSAVGGQQQQQQAKTSSTAAKLFVGQLPFECTEERLRNLFSAYGTVEHIHILRDTSNRSRGAAFVTYSTVQEADTAIFTLHNRYRMLTNRAIQVSYAKNSPNISPFGTHSALEVHQSYPTNPVPDVAAGARAMF